MTVKHAFVQKIKVEVILAKSETKQIVSVIVTVTAQLRLYVSLRFFECR